MASFTLSIEVLYLALGTPRVMLLRLGPLGTVESLMSDQIIHRGELYTTRRTY